MRVILLFPENFYSKHKKEIAKMRREIGCVKWNGSGWSGGNLIIEADFQKAALRSGLPIMRTGDVLVLSGAEDLCDLFIKAAPDWGAELEFPEAGVQEVILEIDSSAPIEWFENLAKSRGLSKKFISRWKKLIQIDIDNGNTPVIL